jgi:hypothetical protein
MPAGSSDSLKGSETDGGLPFQYEESLYAGGSYPGVVYEYLGGTLWQVVSQELGYAVLCLCEWNGSLYAGTMSTDNPRNGIGKVWRYDAIGNWTLVGNNMDDQVCSLIVFNGALYAGTAWGQGKLYRYEGGTTWTTVVAYGGGWSGFRSLQVWNGILYIGDIYYDIFGHYDGTTFTHDVNKGGSCIYDNEVYNDNLYASAWVGRIYRSSDGTSWTPIRYPQPWNSWELETYQGNMYVSTGPKLERYDGTSFSLIWTEPNDYHVISMVDSGNALILGTGQEAGSSMGSGWGSGSIYAYDGFQFGLISGIMGRGIQTLLGTYEVVIPPPPSYDATIEAYCCAEGTSVSVSITMDGLPTEYNTPHTFANLTGIHDFTVPSADAEEHPFLYWNTGEASTTITVDFGGTYTALYYEPTYNVTVKAHCNTEGIDLSVNITMDGLPTGYTTPHTFTDLSGNHTFTVPDTYPARYGFVMWNTGDTNTTITANHNGTYTAYYAVRDVAITSVTLSKTVVGQGYCMNITVTVENQGDVNETFGVAAPYFESYPIPTSENWLTFWRMGDVDRDGNVSDIDVNLIAAAYGTTPGSPNWNPDADVNEDLKVDLHDLHVCTLDYGMNIWTCFGLPLPPFGTQRGVKLYAGNQTTLTFIWNTTGFTRGNYVIRAYATPVPYETDTADNTFTAGIVKVGLPGDVDPADDYVGIDDIYNIAQRFGAELGGPPNSNGFYYSHVHDIIYDGYNGIDDTYIASSHFGQEDP